MIRFRLCRPAICLIFAVAIVGCGPPPVGDSAPSVPVAQPASFAAISARDLLGETLSRYASAASYRDNGRAQIRYQNGDSTETRTAPMRVWLDRNELYLETYDVRLTSDPDGLTGWIADPSTDNFDSQVLKSKPIPGRPMAEKLLADPILAGRVAAGLAGPPPQLEWLFSAEPMKALFDPSHRIEFGPTRSIDRQTCRSVIVDAGEQRYQFWIDDRARIVRRIELPPIVAPLVPGAVPQPIQLSIDLVGATFAAPNKPPRIEPLPKSPKTVSRLIPLPPPRPARILGTRVPGFRIENGNQKLTFLVRVSVDTNTIAAAMTAQSWTDQWSEELATTIRTGILVDADAASSIPAEVTVPVVVDKTGEFAKSLEMNPGAAVLVDSSGTVMWVDDQFSPATLASFGAAISDVLSGVDVPDRLRSQWTEQLAAYDHACGEVAVSSN
ncbi:MAG: hypothetical protein WBD31_12475 [Rubripirellula sp.]